MVSLTESIFFTLFRVSPESRRVLLVPSDFITSLKDISDVIISFFHFLSVSFEGFSNQYDIYMRTLQRLVVEKGLEDSLYLHRFEEQLSHFEESLNNLEQNVIRQN